MIGVDKIFGIFWAMAGFLLGASYCGHQTGWVCGILGGIGGCVIGFILGLLYNLVIVSGLDELSIKSGRRSRWTGRAIMILHLLAYAGGWAVFFVTILCANRLGE